MAENIQQLVDFKQESMYPITLIDALLSDTDGNVSGKNALFKSLFGNDAYTVATSNPTHYYAMSINGAKDINDIVNSKCIAGMASFDGTVTNLTGAAYVQVSSNGTFNVVAASDSSTGSAGTADHVKFPITFDVNGDAGSEVTFDGSASKRIDCIKKACQDKNGNSISDYIRNVSAVNGHANQISVTTGVPSAIATTITIDNVANATDASTAVKIKGLTSIGLPYISAVTSGTNIDTLSVIGLPTVASGETKAYVPKFTFNSSGQITEAIYEPVGSDGLGGGGVTLGSTVSSQSYFILGTTTTSGKVTEAFIGGASPNFSPYFRDGNLYQTSDETLKTFTGDLDINLDNLATIKKGLFYWNNDENKILDIGVTAQSVEPLFPEIVSETDGIKAVSYSKLSVVALAAIDKLYARIKELEDEISELKKSK